MNDINKGQQCSKCYDPSEKEVRNAKELYCGVKGVPTYELTDNDEDIIYWIIKFCKEGKI